MPARYSPRMLRALLLVTRWTAAAHDAEIAHRLKGEWPRWGTRRIAGILARLGLRASRTTIQRMLRRPYRPARWRRAARRRRGTTVVAGHPGHTWLLDFTTVGGL